MATYLIYLIVVYPARDPIMAKNSTTVMVAPVRSPVGCTISP